ncbi:hypothetical protein ABT095_08550 [Kitasatospora sp. NPDC002227]|uniref:hypothetical protein n=1 Tax=Kitasatospora sp. NPDC002227 TaxID=3154773 RepID=UPI00332ECEB6
MGGVAPLVLIGLVDACLILLVMAGRYAGVAVGQAGLSTRRGPQGWKTWAWSEIADIEVRTYDYEDMFGGRLVRMTFLRHLRHLGSGLCVRVTPVRGRRFYLPVLGSSMVRPDPGFDTKCDQLMDTWERYA